MTIQETIDAVRQWGLQRNITGPNGKGTLLGQLSKTAEELTETRDAAVFLQGLGERRFLEDPEISEARDIQFAELKDGIGDTAITLILAAEMAGLRIEDCLAAAYDEIKGRTGRMENGIFIKDTP
jgi:NTP pyrophosphatase (non-canonical NTP hydrolase)